MIVILQIFERVELLRNVFEEVDHDRLENADEIHQLGNDFGGSVDDLIGNDNDGGCTVICRQSICLDAIFLDLFEHVICGLGTAQFIELSRNVVDSGVLVGIGVDNDLHILFFLSDIGLM